MDETIQMWPRKGESLQQTFRNGTQGTNTKPKRMKGIGKFPENATGYCY